MKTLFSIIMLMTMLSCKAQSKKEVRTIITSLEIQLIFHEEKISNMATILSGTNYQFKQKKEIKDESGSYTHEIFYNPIGAKDLITVVMNKTQKNPSAIMIETTDFNRYLSLRKEMVENNDKKISNKMKKVAKLLFT